MSERAAPADHDIHPVIAERWSPRAFAERPVEHAKLRAVFEAARWAPSCYNEQPWRFFVATRDERDAYQRLFACLVEANQAWVGAAPVLALSVACLRFARNDKPNRHAMHDVGLAAENLVLQATALGLVAHQMAGFDVAKAKESFSLDNRFEPAAMIALGYPGDPGSLDGRLRELELAPRVRKPLAELVASERLGSAPSWLEPQ